MFSTWINLKDHYAKIQKIMLDTKGIILYDSTDTSRKG